MTTPADHDHWLVRPQTIRWLWIVSIVVLALTVIVQWWLPYKGYFGVDGWFGFAAGFGFLACVVMVLVAKLLGVLLKRPEDYYREAEDD